MGVAGDLAHFGQHLKDADLDRVIQPEEQPNFGKEKYAKESEQRENDRQERKEEREAARQLELERSKIIFEVFKQQSKWVLRTNDLMRLKGDWQGVQ